jgi:hypothetical protein
VLPQDRSHRCPPFANQLQWTSVENSHTEPVVCRVLALQEHVFQTLWGMSHGTKRVLHSQLCSEFTVHYTFSLVLNLVPGIVSGTKRDYTCSFVVNSLYNCTYSVVSLCPLVITRWTTTVDRPTTQNVTTHQRILSPPPTSRYNTTIRTSLPHNEHTTSTRPHGMGQVYPLCDIPPIYTTFFTLVWTSLPEGILPKSIFSLFSWQGGGCVIRPVSRMTTTLSTVTCWVGLLVV